MRIKQTRPAKCRTSLEDLNIKTVTEGDAYFFRRTNHLNQIIYSIKNIINYNQFKTKMMRKLVGMLFVQERDAFWTKIVSVMMFVTGIADLAC